MYGVDGRKDLKEQILDHLEGYRGSAPVRIGNGAFDQLQIDIHGELHVAVDAYDQRRRLVSHWLWSQVPRSVTWTCNNWRRKDEGVWEVRAGPPGVPPLTPGLIHAARVLDDALDAARTGR